MHWSPDIDLRSIGPTPSGYGPYEVAVVSAVVARQMLREGEHGARLYGGEPVRGFLGTLRIDLLRGGGMLLVPVGIAFAWIILRGALTPVVAIWPEITGTIANMALPLMLATVVIGGYAGGRERRGAVDEMTGTTPIPAWQRYLSLTGSLIVWAMAVYTVFAIPLLVYGMGRATWGGPDIGVIVVRMPYIALAAVFGVGVGRWIGGKTAPVIALAAFVLVFSVLPSGSEVTSLLGVMNPTPWFRPVVENMHDPGVPAWAQIMWGVGLVSVVVGLDIWREIRTRSARMLLAGAVVVALCGAAFVAGAGYKPPAYPGMPSVMNSPAGGICDDTGPIEVCVHPAYERMLPNLTRDVHAYLGPVAGLDGVVARVYVSSGNQTGGSWYQDDDFAVKSIDLAPVNWSVRDLLGHELWPMSFMVAQEPADPAQYVVMTALARNIGIDSWPEHFYRVPSNANELAGDVDRFAALSPDEQRAWLEVNWDNLIHGRLRVEDLPC